MGKVLTSVTSVFHWLRNWRNGILGDALTAAVEALFAVAFSYLWVIVLVVVETLRTTDASFSEAFQSIFTENFEPADALKNLTAILSATTAYILLRLYGVREHILRIVWLLLLIVAVWIFGIPLFLESTPENQEFAIELAVFLMVAGLVLWWFSLFTQRRIFERQANPPSDDGARRISKKLENYR